LRAHVAWVLATAVHRAAPRRRRFGTAAASHMVRALTSARQYVGSETLQRADSCSGSGHVAFDVNLRIDESEEKAVAAFYRPGARTDAPSRSAAAFLCLDSNADVLAYLRELLRGAGYDVQTSGRISDALILMRVTRFDLLLAGPGLVLPRPRAASATLARSSQ